MKQTKPKTIISLNFNALSKRHSFNLVQKTGPYPLGPDCRTSFFILSTFIPYRRMVYTNKDSRIRNVSSVRETVATCKDWRAGMACMDLI